MPCALLPQYVFAAYGTLLGPVRAEDMTRYPSFRYVARHVVSGSRIERIGHFVNREAFETSLQRWNQDPRWSYQPAS